MLQYYARTYIMLINMLGRIIEITSVINLHTSLIYDNESI